MLILEIAARIAQATVIVSILMFAGAALCYVGLWIVVWCAVIKELLPTLVSSLAGMLLPRRHRRG